MPDALRKRNGLILLGLWCGVILILLVTGYRPVDDGKTFHARSGRGRAAVQTVPEGPICANTAGAEELTKLPGIGPVLAENWITEREGNGPFFYPEDLLTIRGIGNGKLEKIRDQLNFSFPGE